MVAGEKCRGLYLIPPVRPKTLLAHAQPLLNFTQAKVVPPLALALFETFLQMLLVV